MPRSSTTRTLGVWMNGELVGHWVMPGHGRQEFRYATSWVESPDARPLSLSMPLQSPDIPYRDERVESFFDNLLPDSQDIRKRVQARFGTASTAAFELLAMIGRDCVGAIQLLAPDEKPRGLRSIEGAPLTNKGIAAVLRAAVTTQAMGQRDSDDFRISIAGVQEKTALLHHNGRWCKPHGSTPTTHIFKLPLGQVGRQLDMSTSVENEWLCSSIVRSYGLEVAHCDIARFEDQRALVVTRFDRKLSKDGKWIVRLPMEDLCQATATPPGHKYQADGGPGIHDIMRLLLGSRTAQADRRAFFKTQVLFWMLGAIDGHAKNFSVYIEPEGRYSLTPLYDILSVYPIVGRGANRIAEQKVRMAMSISGTSRQHYVWKAMVRRHWLATADACDFGSEAAGIIDELVVQTPGVVAQISKTLPPRFPESVSTPILNMLKKATERLKGED